MNEERLTGATQENLLALLAHDDANGRIVYNMVNPQLFEGDYRVIATRCCEYWRVHNIAPKMHAPDLVSDILEDKHNRKRGTFKRILENMQVLAEEGVNASYVVNELTRFTRLQKLKDAILRSAEMLNQPGPTSIEQTETLLADILRARDYQFDAGMRLDDVERFLDFIAKNEVDEFASGIKALDQGHIVPARGTSMTFLAPSGYGKSWFLCNVGKHAMLQRKRVLHVSLEMSEEQVLGRYYQALYSVPRRFQWDKDDLGFEFYSIEHDKARRVMRRLKAVKVDPGFALNSEEVGLELRTRAERFGRLLQNVRIKRFPTRSLTVDGLEGYIDSLEQVYGFTPDMLILDYPGIMKTDAKNHRITLGRTFEDLRGLLVRRNMAGAFAHQTSKKAMGMRRVTTEQTGEDFSVIQTSDTVLTYSATPAERRRGLARLYVDKARNERDGWGLLLSQSYDLGQFVMDHMYLPNSYFDKLERLDAKDKAKNRIAKRAGKPERNAADIAADDDDDDDDDE